jgi:shikimate dehydrogenase
VTPPGAPRLFALLGDPVDHSLSPAIQHAALRASGLHGCYAALRCDAAELPLLMRSLARSGGGGNITVPHKELAVPALQRASTAVRRTGACNTFWWEDDRLCGDNTDVAGFAAAARELLGSCAGARVLLVGAGGAARAAVHALLEEHADAVFIFGRTSARALRLQEELDPGGRRVRVVTEPGPLRREGFDLIVNATPLGLRADDPAPFDLDGVHRAGAVLDMVYSPAETAWVRKARARGIPAADGLEMLLRQAAAAFCIWWGREAPLAAMRQAVPR